MAKQDFSLFETQLDERAKSARERILVARERDCGNVIDLSANDYLCLAQNEAVKTSAIAAVEKWGASASASPLVTGYKAIHAQLERALCEWIGFECGLIWNTGFAANCAVLGTLPQRDDLILADRLIHNSMINGILKSGARFQRFCHNDLAHLRQLLEKNQNYKNIFVAVESVYSMDGDSPDLRELTILREEFGFVLIVDEAHATGWFGENGGGLVQALGLQKNVDILVGTLGKSLGAAGAYTLFNDEILRRYLINFASEFIYSTYLPPAAAGAALGAIEVVKNFSPREREAMPALSKKWREAIRTIVPTTDCTLTSPVISIILGEENKMLEAANALKNAGFVVGAIRPPTVPAGTSRLRISLNRNLSDTSRERFCAVLKSVS